MSFATIQLITHPKDKPVLKLNNGAAQSGIIALLDDQGLPYDLTAYMPTDATPVTSPRYLPVTRGIVLDLSNYYGQSRPDLEKICTVQGDPSAGEIFVEIAPEDIRYPGLYMGNVLLVDGGEARQIFELYVESAPSIAWYNQGSHPLTISEIRLWARDTQPAVNDLLDEVEYSDNEIAAAIRRGIDLWNGTTPYLRNYTFNTTSFPAEYRSQWINVTIGFLKIMAADWYERNHLPYSAGGVSIDDRNKFQGYRQDGYAKVQEYQMFVKDAKVSLNMRGGFGRTGFCRLP